MQTCDFSRSFITFRAESGDRGNHPRIQVESICTLHDSQIGEDEIYYLVASCKSEDTYGKGVLFSDPNYDFCVIFSDKEFRIIRVGVPDVKPETVGDNLRHFNGVEFTIRMAEGETLADAEAIYHATQAGRVLNGRVVIADATGRYTATLEFPIKTINVFPKPSYIYQVDTGPLALPDFASTKARWVERFKLAFVAYQKPGEAYFVSQVPTPVESGKADSPKVRHYSAIERMDAQHSVIALR